MAPASVALGLAAHPANRTTASPRLRSLPLRGISPYEKGARRIMKNAALTSPRPMVASDSAAQHIEQALRRAIVTLELRPGERLSENEVALRFGVSRQPAREAMIALAKIGLVRVVPRGTVVVKISTRQMMQVRFTRQAPATAIIPPPC